MVAVFALDRSHACRFLNAVAESMTGVPLSRAVGMPFQELAWRDNPQPFEVTPLSRALVTGTGGEGEQLIMDADRAFRHVAFRVVPLEIGDGATIIELTDLSGETGTARALRESEQRLRLAIDATGIGIWDVNVVTGARRWSDQFYNILGLPPGVHADHGSFTALIHPDDRERVSSLYEAALHSSGPGRYEAEFRICRNADHVARWVLSTGRVTFDDEGHPLRAVGILRDTTERREVEETLRKGEEQLRLALAAGRMGTWRRNLATGEHEWDDTQYRLFGLSPGQPASRDLYLSVVHPDDLAKVDIDIGILPLDNSFLDSEYRVIWPSGEVHWMSSHALVRYDPDRKPYEVIGVNHDISAHKRVEEALRVSEERHRLAVEANDVGTWDYDLVRGEGRWSDQAKRLLGLPAESNPSEEVLHAMVSPEDWFTVQQKWRAAVDPDGGGRFASEHQISRADDSARRWCYFAGQVFFDEESRRPVRAVGIVLDTTDRKEVEERQRVMLREMNHRVKNSLAVIQAIVSQTIRLTSNPQEAFEQIQSRVMSVARTHDFLDRSRVGEASMRGLLALELEPLVEDAPLRLRLEGPAVLLGSSSVLSLGLTLHELGANAVKFGALAVPEGRVEINWGLRDDRGRTFVDLYWKESGGPAVHVPKRKGFGSRLIEGSIAGTLGGSVNIDYNPAGMVARLSFPLAAANH